MMISSTGCPENHKETMRLRGRAVAVPLLVVALAITIGAMVHWRRVDVTLATSVSSIASGVAVFIAWVVTKIRSDPCLPTPCGEIDDLSTGIERAINVTGSVLSLVVLVTMLQNGTGVLLSLGASTIVQLVVLACAWLAGQWVRNTPCNAENTEPKKM